jgi:hypothetical protein
VHPFSSAVQHSTVPIMPLCRIKVDHDVRLADVPCFRLDLAYRNSEDFDSVPCEYCSAIPAMG